MQTMNSVDTISFGGVTVTKRNNIKIITARAPNPNYDTFRYRGSMYQVPVGKTAIIRAVCYRFNIAAPAPSPIIGHSTASASNVAGAPAGYTAITLGGMNNEVIYNTTTQEVIYLPMDLEIAAGKFITMLSNGLCGVSLLIEEV